MFYEGQVSKEEERAFLAAEKKAKAEAFYARMNLRIPERLLKDLKLYAASYHFDTTHVISAILKYWRTALDEQGEWPPKPQKGRKDLDEELKKLIPGPEHVKRMNRHVYVRSERKSPFHERLLGEYDKVYDTKEQTEALAKERDEWTSNHTSPQGQ